MSPGICGQRRPRSACTFAQSNRGLYCQLIGLLDTTEYKGLDDTWRKYRIIWLHTFCMFEGTFWLDAVKINTTQINMWITTYTVLMSQQHFSHQALQLSNKQPIMAPDKQLFFISNKRYQYFLFLYENVCFVYSLEVPHWGTSNECPKHTFSWRNKKKHLPRYFCLELPMNITVKVLKCHTSKFPIKWHMQTM